MLTLLLLGLSSMVAMAQNKVAVSQNGSGNSVSINQGSEKQSDNAGCPEANINATGNNNIIKIIKGGSNQKTVLHQSNAGHNDLSALLLNLHALEALQNGDANSLLLSIPAEGNAPQSFSTSQDGEGNNIAARMPEGSAKVSVTQNGSGNSVTVNPCDEQDSATESGSNSVNIQQSGSGNSASISQN